jgi:hypothetical protein
MTAFYLCDFGIRALIHISFDLRVYTFIFGSHDAITWLRFPCSIVEFCFETFAQYRRRCRKPIPNASRKYNCAISNVRFIIKLKLEFELIREQIMPKPYNLDY